MNILQLNDFVSERVKVKPVTNAELDKIKQDVYQRKQAFNVKNIKHGTIIMFSDYTLGVYLDAGYSYEILTFFGCKHPNESYYLTVNNPLNMSAVLIRSAGFTDDLKLHINENVYVIRVYEKPLTQDELKSLAKRVFYPDLKDFAESRKYIERP